MIIYFISSSNYQNVWMTNVACNSTTSCIGSCQNCSKASIPNCNNDVLIQCGKGI